jgi:hypothetical protein
MAPVLLMMSMVTPEEIKDFLSRKDEPEKPV